MKKKKIIIFILMILLTVFYGCTRGKDRLAVKKGIRLYKEVILNEILGEDYISSIEMNNNNELVLYSEGNNKKYLILDEKDKVKKEIILDFDGRGELFGFTNKNTMYILSEIPKRNENKDITGLEKKFLLYNSKEDYINRKNLVNETYDSTVKSIEDMTIKIEVDSKGNIYALKFNGSVEVYDNNLQLKKIIDSFQYNDLEVDEKDNLLVLHKSTQSKILEKIDTSDYKTIWRREYKSTDAPEAIYYNKSSQTLYGVNSNWIVKYDLEGKMIRRLLNTAELSTIELITDFLVDDNEEIYLIAQNQQKYNIIKYTKIDTEEKVNNTTGEDKTEIVIELNKDWLKLFMDAEKKFEKKYSDINVIVKTNPDLNSRQYREKLNTELMAGKGPDILYLNSYDYLRAYMDKGMLVNLDEMIKIDKDFNINDYNKRIIDMARYKDKLYVVPMNFYRFYIFVLNEKLLDEKGVKLDDNMTWRNLYNLSEKLSKNSKDKIYVLPRIQDEVLFENIIWQDIDYYIDWNNKKSRFNSKEFISTLELLKSIKENSIMHPELSWDYIINEYDDTDIDLSNIAIYLGQTNAYHYINSFGSYFNKNFKAVSAPKGEYTGSRQFQSNFLAINSNSKHKNEAWKFIKFILSEEVQITDEGHFHINNNANKKQIAEVYEFQENNKETMEKNKLYYVKDEDIKELNRIIGNLNKLMIGDAFYDVVFEEVMSYLKGEKTAEETARILQNKAEIYLLE
jgi:ABC-type glycerol-3-phosphate transport system substrate-binding protein